MPIQYDAFVLFVFLDKVLRSPDWPQTHCTAKADLEFMILLPLLPSY